MLKTTTTKRLWASCLAIILLEAPASVSLSNDYQSMARHGYLSSKVPAFSSRACRVNLQCPSSNYRLGRYPLSRGKKTRQLSILQSMTASRDETMESVSSADTMDGTSPVVASNGDSDMSELNSGSTAIILNMNARSVTPRLISIASDIVGENNVFVTKSIEDAKLAARTVVRGCSSTANGDSTATGESSSDHDKARQKYSLVVPVGGDGTLSGWINTMVDEILLFNKLEHDAEDTDEDNLSKSNETETGIMSVEEAVQQLPLVGYIPMGTGNGLGYVIGCKSGTQSNKNKSLLSKINVLSMLKPKKLDRARQVMTRLKEVGDVMQTAEQMEHLEELDITNAVSGKCSVVEMPLMEVTHPDPNTNAVEEKGDLCFFAGAGFDSLMLHDFQQIKAWSKSTKSAPAFVKDALSSVTGYCVALVTKTLPQTLKHGTHKIHVEVTTTDEDTLWVDHRRGDFSELAVSPNNKQQRQNGKELNGGSNSTKSSPQQHLIYSGETGIIAAATTPYYGGGLRLFPYARLIPDKLQLRLGRISPLTGFFNMPSIFAGSYREKGERSFGCLDFIGKEFEVEVTGGKYEEYMKRKCEEKKKRKKSLPWFRRGKESEDSAGSEQDCDDCDTKVVKGFPFQHSGESMGVKERFRLRVVQEPVKFVSFLAPRVIVDD